jgi:hypothetical protein
LVLDFRPDFGCSGPEERLVESRISLGAEDFSRIFQGQTFALMTAGTMWRLYPSVTAKSVIMAPLSKGISDAMGFPHKSRRFGSFRRLLARFVCTGVSF